MKELISKIPADKLRHYIVCALLYRFTALFIEGWVAAIIVIAFAILWELIHDGLMKKGTPELADVVCSFFGVASMLAFDYIEIFPG